MTNFSNGSGALHPGPMTPRVQLVGPFGVFVGGRRVAPTEVGSRKARMILALLAVRQNQLVPADDILHALWPDHPPQKAVANIATLVSRLRVVLGHGVITGERGAYRLGRHVEVDLIAAARLLDLAERNLRQDTTAARSAAQQGADLLGEGTVLADHPDAPWAESARTRLASLTRRARLILAEATLLLGSAGVAERMAALAVAADPYDEPGYRALMCAHAAAGEPVRALRAYHRLRTILADEMGIDPALPTQDMYLSILRNEVPDPRGIRVGV